MNVKLKVGSVITVPVGNTGFGGISDDPATLKIEQTGGNITLTAIKAGPAKVSLLIASDLMVTLAVIVVA